ncbi:hypothetical protein [Herbaspirillum sp. CAH-3]|uniref:hypothetical protein n=1 Tax=Herbaspirillum sp. CAH-3 TaxID=2605746 RepID=UPI0012ACB5DD|nr:hypothetical protein [Herbaspirillum sp. CAH-3]MRT27600.1 hypothetical protein [Herbaspirillum sp. CAH-3]
MKDKNGKRVYLEVFADFDQIERFVKDSPENLMALREFVASRFNALDDRAQQVFVQDWLSYFDANEERRFQLEGRDIERRNVEATEASAQAAAESARTAGQSARAAIASTIFALGALLLSIAAYIRGS